MIINGTRLLSLRVKLTPPRHIRSLDKILFLQNEILVLPHDIEGDDTNEGENILYTKTDSKRLEKFLKDEAASFWKRPEKNVTSVA